MRNIVQIVSENKTTRKQEKVGEHQRQLFKAKIGYAEAIVEENGKRVTRHMVSLKDYDKQKS